MLRIAKWNDWQAAPLTKIRGKRRENKVAENAPYAMPKVFVASALDGRFVEFAESVGSNAESYFLRTLQYVALHDPFGGTVNVRREAFGPIVLTRAWDVVGKAKGCAVFDALLSTGIGENVPQGAPRTESAGEPYGAPQGEPSGAPDGDASANSGSGSGSGSGAIHPPTPSGGSGSKELTSLERSRIEGGCRALAADPKADHALRTAAAELGNAVRLGTADPVKARGFWRSKLNPNPSYRVPALTAGGDA